MMIHVEFELARQSLIWVSTFVSNLLNGLPDFWGIKPEAQVQEARPKTWIQEVKAYVEYFILPCFFFARILSIETGSGNPKFITRFDSKSAQPCFSRGRDANLRKSFATSLRRSAVGFDLARCFGFVRPKPWAHVAVSKRSAPPGTARKRPGEVKNQIINKCCSSITNPFSVVFVTLRVSC